MRRILSTLLLIFAINIINAGVNTQQSENSSTKYFDAGNPIKFCGEKYYFSWSSHPTDFYYIQEYLPKGETPEHFNSMLTVAVIFNDKGYHMDAKKAAQMKIQELEQRKKTDKVCNYISLENDGEYMIDFIVSQGNDEGISVVEFNLHHYFDTTIDGRKAHCLVFFSRRAYEDDILPFMKSIPEHRQEWYENLTNLKIKPKF